MVKEKVVKSLDINLGYESTEVSPCAFPITLLIIKVCRDECSTRIDQQANSLP